MPRFAGLHARPRFLVFLFCSRGVNFSSLLLTLTSSVFLRKSQSLFYAIFLITVIHFNQPFSIFIKPFEQSHAQAKRLYNSANLHEASLQFSPIYTYQVNTKSQYALLIYCSGAGRPRYRPSCRWPLQARSFPREEGSRAPQPRVVSLSTHQT
jgi:hypothetical protein